MAKEVLGNKKAMVQWQDDFYAHMAERWPELERGTSAVETKRRHLTPQWYKKVTEMDAKLERMETVLSGVNVLNAGKKRDEAIALLSQLLPDVESFQAEAQRLRDAAAVSRNLQEASQKESAALYSELQQAEKNEREQNTQISALQSRCKRAEMLLKRPPPEVLREIKRGTLIRER